jgi:hypothetical protein
VEEFLKLSAKAEVCFLKRSEDGVKLKLRTSKYLYTLKTDEKHVEEVKKKIKCRVEEI